ncbi:hypothetical protein C2I36_16060, partial [Rhodobacteraceae bacterium WD3A24]
AGAASAMTGGSHLSAHDRAEIRQLVPGADLQGLSNAQEAALHGMLVDPDGTDQASRARGQIRSILTW